MEKHKIQIFCGGKKLQFSKKNSRKFSFCEIVFHYFYRGLLIQVLAASISDLPKKKLLIFDTWL
jgi:hypothetical protein